MPVLETEYLWHTLFSTLYFDTLLEKGGPKQSFSREWAEKYTRWAKLKKENKVVVFLNISYSNVNAMRGLGGKMFNF